MNYSLKRDSSMGKCSPLHFLAALALWGVMACTSSAPSGRDEIGRISQQMERYFKEQQPLAVAALFEDSAMIGGLGGYRVQGRQVIDDFWARYYLPIDMQIRSRRIDAGLSEMVSSGEWPDRLQALPAEFMGSGNEKTAFQWAEWAIRYEAEDGTIRTDRHTVLIRWDNIPGVGWRIRRLFLA